MHFAGVRECTGTKSCWGTERFYSAVSLSSAGLSEGVSAGSAVIFFFLIISGIKRATTNSTPRDIDMYLPGVPITQSETYPSAGSEKTTLPTIFL